MITQEKLDEAILDVTGDPNWDIMAAFLAREALVARDSCADVDSWEEVNKRRGFADGIAYVLNLREMTVKAMEQSDADIRL